MGKPRKYLRPTEQRMRYLYPKHLDKEIGLMFGVPRRTIVDWRRDYGIPGVWRQPRRINFDRPQSARPINAEFFASIDTEHKAYALGLLATDGSIHRSGKQIFLSLQARDKHILYDLRRAMGSNAPVRDKKAGGFPGSGPQKAICFSCKQLVGDLAKLGVGPAKSLILKYTKVPPHLERHYIRGMFDGDGCVHPDLFSFLGTLAVMKGIKSAIRRHLGISMNIRPIKKLWRISGYRGSKQVLNWMYDDAAICLRRKRKLVREHWQ